MRSCSRVDSLGADAGCTDVTWAGAGASPAVASGLLVAAQRMDPAASAATIGDTTAAAAQLARVGRFLVIVALVLVVLVLVLLVLVVLLVIVLVVLTLLVFVFFLVVAVAAG